VALTLTERLERKQVTHDTVVAIVRELDNGTCPLTFEELSALVALYDYEGLLSLLDGIVDDSLSDSLRTFLARNLPQILDNLITATSYLLQMRNVVDRSDESYREFHHLASKAKDSTESATEFLQFICDTHPYRSLISTFVSYLQMYRYEIISLSETEEAIGVSTREIERLFPQTQDKHLSIKRLDILISKGIIQKYSGPISGHGRVLYHEVKEYLRTRKIGRPRGS
jgi:hypothetical protein